VEIKKAVITAGGRGARLFPAANTVHKAMLPLIDRDGLAKPVIQIIAEEALASGIEELCVVCAPGDEDQYRGTFHALRDNLMEGYENVEWAREQAGRVDDLLRRLRFAVQAEPLGYGHAVYCTRDFTGPDPFLLLLSDHLYISHRATRCAQQLIDLATEEQCAVAAAHSTPEHLVSRYGTLTGKPVTQHAGVYRIERILEKPSLSVAEQSLLTPGLRAGHYLCFFGMHVLTPAIFTLLEESLSNARGRAVQLTPSLQDLARREKYLALEVAGSRYDIGRKFGLLQTQLALAMAGVDRDEALRTLVELTADSRHPSPGAAI
jgi:UTP--glucose-1-phosphate uridylyltransferase